MTAIHDSYPPGAVIHGLTIVAYIRRDYGHSGARAWTVRVRCDECGRSFIVRLAKLLADRETCYCLTA